MRIAIACMGSRGDITPLLALATKFVDRGDEVRIGCTIESRDQVRSHGFEPLILTTLNIKEFLQSPTGQRNFFGAGTTTQLRAVGELADDHADEFDGYLAQLCSDVDCVISTRVIEERAALVSHRAGPPLVAVEFFPGDAHSAVPNPLLSAGLQDLAAKFPVLIPLTYRIFDVGWAASIAKKTLGLARRMEYPRRIINPRSVFKGRDVLRVEAFGTALVPSRTRQDPRIPRIGFIRLDARPADRAISDAHVDAWLSRDDRPVVYLGFGSMPVPGFETLVGELAALLGEQGVRLLVAPGWSRCDNLASTETADLLIAPDVDHRTVLSRCAALIHHGGAGTTAIAAASGVPSLIYSQAFDQHFWARRVASTGAGRALSRAEMTAASIAAEVQRLLSDGHAARAAQRLRDVALDDLDGREQFFEVLDGFLAEIEARRSRVGSQRSTP